MGIAGFSPQFGRTAGLSMLLAPIQALAALFAPIQAAPVHTRPAGGSVIAQRAPAQPFKTLKLAEAQPPRKIRPVASVQRLKIVRQFEPGANRSCAGRLVISGRMSDVCAELERMAG